MSAANASTLAPTWFEQFHESPAVALDDLLFGRAWLDALAGGDPAEALLDLARVAHLDASFSASLDRAICGWLSENFGKPPACQVGRWANAFRGAFLAVEELELRSAARVLRRDIESWRSYLRGFYDGPSQDPESAYLRAVAANQEDRELLGLWLSICRLEPSLPPHFGLVGILGLRWLPDEKGGPPADINSEVTQGLLLLGMALVPFGSEGEAEFKRVLRLTRAAHPRSPQTWAGILHWEREGKSEFWCEVNSWVNEALPDIVRTRPKQPFVSLENLKPGMVIEGTVTNVTNFGAFVDIGLAEDGLVHVSHLARRYVDDPNKVVGVGRVVRVKVLSVDLERRRIALSIKDAMSPPRERQAAPQTLKTTGLARERRQERRGKDRAQRDATDDVMPQTVEPPHQEQERKRDPSTKATAEDIARLLDHYR